MKVRGASVRRDGGCDDLSRRIAGPYRVLISDFCACLINTTASAAVLLSKRIRRIFLWIAVLISWALLIGLAVIILLPHPGLP
jgi:hypothetical protein